MDEENFSKVHRRDEKRMNTKVVDMFNNVIISPVWNLIFRWNTVWAINKINCFVAMTNKKISLIFVTCKLSPCRLKLLGRTLKSDLSQMPNFRVKTFYQLLIIRPSGRLLCERSLELSRVASNLASYLRWSERDIADVMWKIAHGVLPTKSYFHTWKRLSVSERCSSCQARESISHFPRVGSGVVCVEMDVAIYS